MGHRPQRDIVDRSVDHEERLRRIETNRKGGGAGYQSVDLPLSGWAVGSFTVAKYGNVVALWGSLRVTEDGHFIGDAIPGAVLDEPYRPPQPVGQRVTFFQSGGGADQWEQQAWVNVYVMPDGTVVLGEGGDS